MVEEYEEEELEEEVKRKPIDLDQDRHIVVTTVKFPRNILKQLGHIAVDEGVSRGEIIRRAVKEYLRNRKEEQETESKIPDKELDKLLKQCSPDEDSFEIEGEDGFIERFKAKGWKLKDLTPEQWEKVKEKIEIGYRGYFFAPELEEFAEKFKSLEPSEEQYEWLSTAEEEEIED